MTKGKPWDAQYEVAISLELATTEGVRVHRPFVAVWVVDKQQKPVRRRGAKSKWPSRNAAANF